MSTRTRPSNLQKTSHNKCSCRRRKPRTYRSRVEAQGRPNRNNPLQFGSSDADPLQDANTEYLPTQAYLIDPEFDDIANDSVFERSESTHQAINKEDGDWG
jgi:hypothetical protein